MPRRPTSKSPRVVPEGPKSARTRERILDAAARVLSRKGYAGTRLTDVAEQAGLQTPAIYYYFPSGDDLIEEVMWTGLAHMHEHVDQALAALPADTDALARIDTAVEAHLRYELELSDYTTASIRNAGQVPAKIRARYAAEARKYGDVWRHLLLEAIQSGHVRPDLDPSVARMLVLGALNWAAEWWNPRRGSIETVVRTAQSLVRHGLSVDQSKPARTRRSSRPARR